MLRFMGWPSDSGAKDGALLQESLSAASKTEALKPSDLNRVIVDTTVQPKNVTFPTDDRLLHRAREILVRLANRYGVKLRQSYACVGKFALIKHQRYAHAKQFKRANRALKTLKTYLGGIIRDIARKLGGNADLLGGKRMLALARQVRDQSQRQRTQELFAARTGGGMHRQRQGTPALRVRHQSLRGHHAIARRGRAVRHPCEGAVRQPL